jgi:hypothetical protein
MITTGVSRDAASARLDGLVASILEKAGGVIPPDALPAAADLGKLGLDSLFGFHPNEPI